MEKQTMNVVPSVIPVDARAVPRNGKAVGLDVPARAFADMYVQCLHGHRE